MLPTSQSLPLALATLAALSLVPSTLGCFDHTYHRAVRRGEGNLFKRAEAGGEAAFDYAFPQDWATLNANFSSCQDGTNQGPIALVSTDAISAENGTHAPDLSGLNVNASGVLGTTGFGVSFTLAHGDEAEADSDADAEAGAGTDAADDVADISAAVAASADDHTSKPSFTFDNETVYLSGWHIHTPAEHVVDGVRSRAELHMVHTDAAGTARAVLAIRLDDATKAGAEAADTTTSAFFASLPEQLVGFNSTETVDATVNPTLALQEAGNFEQYWTYTGSLTTPPCTEGLRFFVSAQTMLLSNAQMQAVLRAGRFSARPTQEIWLHGVNV